MKSLLIFCLLLTPLFAQATQESIFPAGKNYYECEDQWVVLNGEVYDTTYQIGFVYLDIQAGFTLDIAGSIKRDSVGNYTFYPTDPPASIKARLSRPIGYMSPLTDSAAISLGLPIKPEWLEIYKRDEESLGALIQRGYHYNHIGLFDKSLPLLEKAYALDNQAEGVAFELSFVYNATQQYDKAITLLEKAIEQDSKNAYLYKELSYAYHKTNQIKNAEKATRKGIKATQDNSLKSEMAFNMAASYAQLGDEKKFVEWLQISKDHAEKGSYIASMIDEYELYYQQQQQ